jgi:adenylyltransferase/sulfurtransferase
LEVLAKRWADLGVVDASRFFVRLRLEDEVSITVFRDGRAVVEGTDEIAKAKSLHARYVGG